MSFEFHINGNQTTFFILFVLRSCTFGFADYKCDYPEREETSNIYSIHLLLKKDVLWISNIYSSHSECTGRI